MVDSPPEKTLALRWRRVAPDSRNVWLIAALAIACTLLLLPRLIAFWDITSALVRWPWQFDFDEGHNLNATVLLAHGTNIYQPNGPDHFVSAPYTPLFYVVNAPFIWFLGPTFGPGRLLSALSTVAIAGLLAWIIKILTRKWWLGLVAGALWLSISPVIVWAALYKQDMPAIALQVAGLAWVLRYSESNRRYIAVAFFALAFFTKQSAVAAAVAASFWLILRDWRVGLRFVGLIAAAIFVPFLIGDLLTNDGMTLHIIGYQSKPWSAENALHLLSRLWDEYWPIIIAATGVLVGVLVRITLRTRQSGPAGTRATFLRGPDGAWALIGLYALVAAVWICIATGIEGGNYNLLLDGLPPVVLLVPLGAAWLLSHLPSLRRQSQILASGALLLLAGLFVVQLTLMADPRTWYHGVWPGAEQGQAMEGLNNLVARTPGDLYSEDDYLILHNDRPVIYDDSSTFPLLARAGRWDDSMFDQSLRDRRFALIFLWPGSGRLTASESEVFNQNYKQVDTNILNTFVPKPIPDAPQYPLACRLTLDTDVVRLGGYSLGPAEAEQGVSPGGVLHLYINWEASVRLQRSYATFVHLVDASGHMLAGHDEPATGTGQPTTAWPPGQQLTDDLSVPIPKDAPPGRYRLIFGMYANDGGKLTPLVPTCSDPANVSDNAIATGWANVVAP